MVVFASRCVLYSESAVLTASCECVSIVDAPDSVIVAFWVLGLKTTQIVDAAEGGV
jgi:hypothetical protein